MNIKINTMLTSIPQCCGECEYYKGVDIHTKNNCMALDYKMRQQTPRGVTHDIFDTRADWCPLFVEGD